MNTPARKSFDRLSLELLVSSVGSLLDAGPKLALIALLHHYDDRNGRCDPGMKTIGRFSGNVSEKQARRHVNTLIAMGLVASLPRTGRTCCYRFNVAAIQALAHYANRPADQRDPGHSDTEPRTFSTPHPGHFEPPTPPKIDPRTEEGTDKELGGTEARGEPAQAAPTVPPFPVIEDLKTEQPAQPIIPEPADLAGSAIDADTLAALDSARADHGLAPLTLPERELLADSAAAAGVTPQTLAGWRLGELRAAAPLVDAATLAAVNAQRAANGKREPVNLADLVQQARQAGITPAAAVQWILAKPGRNFFRADFYRPEPSATAPAVPAAPVELTEAGKRAQAQIARALAAPAALPALPAMPAMPAASAAAAFIVASPSARPIGAAVTPRHRAPVSVGAATGTGWAQRAVSRFVAAEPIRHATIAHAAAALGLALSDLKAQRAAHLAAVAA